MSESIDSPPDQSSEEPPAAVVDPVPVAPGSVPLGRAALTAAALASLGGGAIHAVCISAHPGHAAAQWAFLSVAVFQIGWGALALSRNSRTVAMVGAAGNAVVLIGWLLTRTTGIGFIDGLQQAERPGGADSVSALLAALAIAGAVVAIVAGDRVISVGMDRAVRAGAVVASIALGAWGMAATGGVVGGGHHHDEGEVAAGADHAMDHDAPMPSGQSMDHDMPAAAVAPVPYDPTKPIDLSGVPGVTPEQQARAENLIAITLARLPKYADPAKAVADGFHSIGDAGTGDEHFINYDYIDDDHILDPDYPESLVYQVKGGKKTLAAAMYMLRRTDTLDTVPDVGGKLMQWHIHDNLCFKDDPTGPKVRGVTPGPDAPCPPGLTKGEPTPMIHVWILPHPCGPFAALDGVGGGTIKAGETKLCDAVHGGHGHG